MKVHHHPNVEKKNFKKYRKEFFIFLFILSFHQAFAQNMHNNDVAIIKSNRAASNEAITKHDVNGISKFWLDDFVQVIGRGTYDTGKKVLPLHRRRFLIAIHRFLMLELPKKLLSVMQIHCLCDHNLAL